MRAKGVLCTIGVIPNLTRLFFYSAGPLGLFIEMIDRRNRDLKHLLQLVDEHGRPVPIPENCRLAHIESQEANNLLENHLSRISREHETAKA